MRVVTGTEMKVIDKRAGEEFGVASSVLMENAGKAIALKVNSELASLGAGTVAIVAGAGNNGGDGFVAARHLHEAGHPVKVIVLADEKSFSGDAAANLKKLSGLLEPVFNPDKASTKSVLADAAVIVDAIFGTGFKGKAPEEAAAAICVINCPDAYVLAVDIPSGVEADTGKVGGAVVEAEETVTFGLPKLGCVVYPGAAYTGRLSVVDIGFPQELIDRAGRLEMPEPKDIALFLPERSPQSYKQSVGRVLVVAGSVGMTGAAALCAQAALKSGAGIVTLACPASLNDILEVKLAEVMTYPLPETEGRTLALDAAPEVLNLLKDFDILVLGPGLSRNAETVGAIRKIVENSQTPLVLDADGINALEGLPELLHNRHGETIITPHPGELARICGGDAKAVSTDRLAKAAEAAEDTHSVTVLKGARSIIAGPDGDLTINPTGNSGLASAGTGDVLAGMIGGLWAQHMRQYNAAVAGVFIHGLAGDLAVQDRTIYSLTALDVIEYLPEAFSAVLETLAG